MSIALGILDRGDINTSFSTRAIGIIMLALLLVAGATLALLSSPKAEGIFNKALTVPIVRADLVLQMLSRLVHIFVWARKLEPNKLLYANEVFPLQAAAIIWNDCKPVRTYIKGEDEATMVVDILSSQRQLWIPTKLDSVSGRIMKAPVFVVVQLLCWFFRSLEKVLLLLWWLTCDRGTSNAVPVLVDGKHIQVTGHTALISDSQLTWIQDFTMKCNGTLDQRLEARRLLVRALHIANLFSHSNFTRLHEHAADGRAMSEYYAALKDKPVIKNVLSKVVELNVLTAYPNGNMLEGGSTVPRQVLWARLVVGSMLGLNGEGRWRGPVASAILQVAQDNKAPWGDHLEFNAMQRHVYTVTRRWLIDWIMYIWWEVSIPASAIYDSDAFFARLQHLLLSNLKENTASLPHAVGELAVSAPQSIDVKQMLVLLLGLDWELWLATCVTSSGLPLKTAIEYSREWKCFGCDVGENSVDASLYVSIKLEAIIAADENASLGEQARARIAGRILETLTERVRYAWSKLPSRLYDPLETEEMIAQSEGTVENGSLKRDRLL